MSPMMLPKSSPRIALLGDPIWSMKMDEEPKIASGSMLNSKKDKEKEKEKSDRK